MPSDNPFGWDLPPGVTPQMIDDLMDPGRAYREAEERRDWESDQAEHDAERRQDFAIHIWRQRDG